MKSKIRCCLVFLIFLFCGLCVSVCGAQRAKDAGSWISVSQTSFIKDGQPFRFIGANAPNIIFYDDWDLDVEKLIRTAKENNISVLRVYLDWGWFKDEDFDRILDITSRYGMYIIAVLNDCCCSGNYSSVKKYFEVHAPFCNITNTESRKAFKRRIRQILLRKNSVNGIIYRDDPTILAWDIANELEYWHFADKDVFGWIQEITIHIRSLDSRHLLTIGIGTHNREFDSDTHIYDVFNISELDFFSFHLYPESKNSDMGNLELHDAYAQKIDFRTKKFISMDKPVILSEFGFSNSAGLNSKFRNDPQTAGSYNNVIKMTMDAAFTAGASGAMFWGWGIPQEKTIPMWWAGESHSDNDAEFCELLKAYKIPEKK